MSPGRTGTPPARLYERGALKEGLRPIGLLPPLRFHERKTAAPGSSDHWVTGSLGHRVTGSLGHWVTGS